MSTENNGAKTHKQTGPITGRPVVSGPNNLTQNASKLVDVDLRPHVQTLPLYIKDTTSFLKAVEQLNIPDGNTDNQILQPPFPPSHFSFYFYFYSPLFIFVPNQFWSLILSSIQLCYAIPDLYRLKVIGFNI